VYAPYPNTGGNAGNESYFISLTGQEMKVLITANFLTPEFTADHELSNDLCFVCLRSQKMTAIVAVNLVWLENFLELRNDQF
jgi:hypothetical protein